MSVEALHQAQVTRLAMRWADEKDSAVAIEVATIALDAAVLYLAARFGMEKAAELLYVRADALAVGEWHHG